MSFSENRHLAVEEWTALVGTGGAVGPAAAELSGLAEAICPRLLLLLLFISISSHLENAEAHLLHTETVLNPAFREAAPNKCAMFNFINFIEQFADFLAGILLKCDHVF